MKHIFVLFLLCFRILFANEAIDRSVSSYQTHSVRRQHVDRFDFVGKFPNLETIDIDATRKKRVELDLSGDYPILDMINYEGSFGFLKGLITGNFPRLSLINILCTSCHMQLDLTGTWHKNCQINIRGQKEDVTLQLPQDVGLVIHTKTAPSGKVIAKQGLKKQGWLKIWNKTYHNDLVKNAPIVLTITIETTGGNIILR